MNDNDEHDHEENGLYAVELPCWRFSLWDVAGITLHTAAGLSSALGQIVGQGLGMLARECAASANRSRQNYDLREAQRLNEAARAEMAASLAAIVDGPEEDS